MAMTTTSQSITDSRYLFMVDGKWPGVDYASAKTEARIYAILEGMWATGDLGETERYRIEHRRGRWFIVLPMVPSWD
jgi:hypothetical protein